MTRFDAAAGSARHGPSGAPSGWLRVEERPCLLGGLGAVPELLIVTRGAGSPSLGSATPVAHVFPYQTGRLGRLVRQGFRSVGKG